MDASIKKDLPDSALKLIFQYIHSQRYLATCMQVNSKWCYFAKRELYNMIHFYSFDQFLHFIYIAEHMDEATSPLSFIHYVVFHFDLLTACDSILTKFKNNYTDNGDNSSNINSNSQEKILYDNDNDDYMKKLEINAYEYGNCNILCARLKRLCSSLEKITLLEKEKHMKQLRYMDITKQINAYAYLIHYFNFKQLPYWHHYTARMSLQKRRQLLSMDIYASTSNNYLIDKKHSYFNLFSLPNLTHLYIDFFHQHKTYLMDHHILNYIHVQCPSLTNLTLVNVDLSCLPSSSSSSSPSSPPPPPTDHTYSDSHSPTLYNENDTGDSNRLRLRYPFPSSSSSPSHFNISFNNNATAQMKHLTLKNVKIVTTTTMDYFIQQYTFLQSLVIHLDYMNFGNTPAKMHHRQKEFQSSMFKLVTHLPELTSFHFTLHSTMNDACAKAIWPQQSILEWLCTHPRQLTSLTWPCDIYDPSVSSSSSSPFSRQPFDTLYLSFLKELNLTIGNQCGEQLILDDFLRYGHGIKKSVLPRLESLTIHHLDRVSTRATTTITKENLHDTTTFQLEIEKKRKEKNHSDRLKVKNKKIHIFTWLTICPQLRSLTLKCVDLIDATDDDDDDDDDDHEAKKEKKAKKRKENMPIYSLNKLTLEQVNIYMKHGLDDICQRCPQLKVLWCDYINCRWQPISMVNYMKDYPTFCENPIFILDASQLTLDTLYLSHINNIFEEYNYTFTIGKAMIYESSSSSSSSCITVMDKMATYFEKKNEDKSTITPFIEIYCRLVDRVTFIGKSDQHDRDAFRGYLLQHPENPEHIRLAKLSRKGLAAYQEEKKHFEEWEYLDIYDDDNHDDEEKEEEEEYDDEYLLC